MVGILIAFPGLVTGNLDKKVEFNMNAVGAQMLENLNQADDGYADYGEQVPAFGSGTDSSTGGAGAPAIAEPQVAPAEEDDPAKAMEDALKQSSPPVKSPSQ